MTYINNNEKKVATMNEELYIIFLFFCFSLSFVSATWFCGFKYFYPSLMAKHDIENVVYF